MFDDAAIPHRSKPEVYRDLIRQLEGVTHGETNETANLANAAAILFHGLPDVNWAGFYRRIGEELVLGPFQGRPACVRIAIGRGVCGTAAATRATQLVDDVHAFAGHIACDVASRAELVVPLIADDRLLGVIDLDSPTPARFDAEDAAGLESVAAVLVRVLA